jgi:hypothetical protein
MTQAVDIVRGCVLRSIVHLPPDESMFASHLKGCEGPRSTRRGPRHREPQNYVVRISIMHDGADIQWRRI